jgi:D-glycero-alpha-D-manno-heptose 1-phosphate guanylyltransferase
MMDAIILAGGFGTRLQSVVSDVPKPMAPINGRPFLEILLLSLEKKGIRRVVLSVGYKAEVIMNYFGNSCGDIELIYEVEDTPLGTGGAIKAALTKCNTEKVLVVNGDTYLEFDMKKLQTGLVDTNQLTVVGVSITDASRYGRIISKDGFIRSFIEKDGMPTSGLINSGHYVVSKNFFDKQLFPEKFSFEIECLEKAYKKIKINLFEVKGMFLDMGTPEDYIKASAIFR